MSETKTEQALADLAAATRRVLQSIYDHADTGEVHPFHTIQIAEAHSALRAADSITPPTPQPHRRKRR